MSLDVINATLAADVATNGTFTVPYPTGTTGGAFSGGYNHKLIAAGKERSSPADFTLAFGASVITVTYKGVTTLPAGSVVRLQLDSVGLKPYADPAILTSKRTQGLNDLILNLGSPIAGAANNVSASQAVLAATASGALLNGAVGVTPDVPRNVVAAWTGTSVLTVTGVDEYGVVVRESSASGTSFTGKKAFAKITSITVSADVTALTAGYGNVLGLPLLVQQVGLVLREMQDGAVATAGTIVAGVTSAASATTGDVRGTYTPNATPDGSKAFALIVLVPSASAQGVTQY